MISHEFPPLTANGLKLDIADDAIGFLKESTDIANDREMLRARLAEDGYLFLPKYLDSDLVQEARNVLTNRLAENDYLDLRFPANEAVAKEGLNVSFLPDLALDNEPLNRLLYEGPTIQLFERIFAEPVLHFDFTWLRATAPGKNASPHCDIVYMGRGTFDVLTAWTPLGDIPLDHGVLMMLEGSHKKKAELKEYLKRDVDSYCSNGPNAQRIESGEMGWEWDGVLNHDAAALRKSLGGRWLTASFNPGDLLVFTMGTVHCSADNLSSKIRLSSDSRYQRASEPADERWIGTHPIGHSLAGKRGRIC